MASDPQTPTELLYHRIFRYALSLCRSPHIAEELTQDCFLRLGQHEISGKQDGNCLRYAIRITRNLWIDRLRSKSIPMDSTTPEELAENSLGAEPWHALETNEEVQAAFALMMQLPPRQREVLYLRTVEEYSIDDIAKSLGIDRGNVKAQLSLARKRMRSFVSEADS